MDTPAGESTPKRDRSETPEKVVAEAMATLGPVDAVFRGRLVFHRAEGDEAELEIPLVKDLTQALEEWASEKYGCQVVVTLTIDR